MTAKRPVGRPRQFDDDAERGLIFDAAYTALRDRSQDFTVADILAAAGVSTRSFYRHFESKDALLCAMYRRDAEWAAERLNKRLADVTSPVEAVTWWIDEIFGLVRNARRAERVAVLGSITGSRTDGAEVVEFTIGDPISAADLVAAVGLHAAGLAVPYRNPDVHDQATTTAFCLAALGTRG